MSDIQKQAKIAELQVRAIRLQTDINAYLALEGSGFDMDQVSDALDRMERYANELKAMAETSDAD